MSAVDMGISQDWAGRNELEANMANIPSERYDIEKFLNGMKELLSEEIQVRLCRTQEHRVRRSVRVHSTLRERTDENTGIDIDIGH